MKRRTRSRGRGRVSAASALLRLPIALSLTAACSAAVALPATTTPLTPSAKTPAIVNLEQCVTSTEQEARTATFSGEMIAIPGTVKMEMRIDVLERLPSELEPAFHNIAAPGLGVWRTAAPGVKAYKYLKQVTNLSAPAAYRAAVRFRWLNAKGKLIKAAELRTPKCDQPLHPHGTPPGETGEAPVSDG
jgi:hypothetical protein